MTHQLDHVAILVPNAGQVVQQLTAKGLPAKGLAPGEIESFPSEGTRECYVGADARLGRLLVMEATSDKGPYARALAKRGPGLHHVALTVPDLDLFLNSVTGWLLVPGCVSSLARTKTAWLARPGVGTLLEVTQHETPMEGVPLLSVEVPASGQERLLTGLSVEGLSASADDQAWIVVGDERLAVAQPFWA